MMLETRVYIAFFDRFWMLSISRLSGVLDDIARGCAFMGWRILGTNLCGCAYTYIYTMSNTGQYMCRSLLYQNTNVCCALTGWEMHDSVDVFVKPECVW